jgi:hypothetical protein
MDIVATVIEWRKTTAETSFFSTGRRGDVASGAGSYNRTHGGARDD